MRRLLGVSLGVGTQLAFAVTAVRLYFFLDGGTATAPAGSLVVDALLALQFAVIHSVLLLPSVRNRLKNVVTAPFYGLFFCLATCGCLWATFLFWKSGPVVWQPAGVVHIANRVLFFGSWLALFYSLWLAGMGYQTGLQPWWYWFRRQPTPRRTFEPRGVFRVTRHPVYASFLGLILFAPTFTADRIVLIAIWGTYTFVGSVLKDQRLLFYVGDEYRKYAERVAGYPLVGFGRLGRWKVEPNPPAMRRAA